MSTGLQTVEPKMLDLLDREEFVNQMISITETLSLNKKNVCYALNGRWGVGKTVVLEMFEEKLSTRPTADKFFIMRYNCWKNDFYKEPLIAIVATLLEAIDNFANALTDEQKGTLKGVFNKAVTPLCILADNLFGIKVGSALKQIMDFCKDIKDDSNTYVSEKHAFDPMFDFKKVLHQLKDSLQELAEAYTIVILVDDIDRCLPEYSIQVLERLHHIFSDIPNIQLILAIDKEQLRNTIKHIYGEQTSAEKYLAKFISFELQLTEGTLNDQFDKRFSAYLSNFEQQCKGTTDGDRQDFIQTILEGMDMRHRIEIIEKCHLIHSLIYSPGTIKDYVFMCIEVFLAVLYDSHFDFSKANAHSLLDNSSSSTTPAGLVRLTEKYKDCLAGRHGELLAQKDDYDDFYYLYSRSIWFALFGTYRYMAGTKNDEWRSGFSSNNVYNKKLLCDAAVKFWEILKIIH